MKVDPKITIKPSDIKSHVNGLVKQKQEAVPHDQILNELIDQIDQVDFHLEAFPQIQKMREALEGLDPNSDEAKAIRKDIDKLKLNNKHYYVISVEKLIQKAEEKKWGLCKNDFVYLYNGQYWKEIDKDNFQNFLGNVAERMGVERISARYYQFRESLNKQFLSSAYFPTPEIPKDKVQINLLNGTYEITPKQNGLKAFDRTDFLTYQLPFEYDPTASAPLFQQYLNRVLPDTELQKVLAEYIGYVFIRNGSNNLKEEKALILYGSGANGKSVFFEIVNALLGVDNVSNFSLRNLTNENGYYRAKIANKLVNYSSEMSIDMDTQIFKQMTSGEAIEGRLPYGEPLNISQYARLIFNCNELPKDVEHTNAYFRRFLIIPFEVTIPEAEQDKNLHNKIIDAELSGVFNWVLSGLRRLLDQKKFTSCDAVQKAIQKYKSESDSVYLFLDENEYQKSTDPDEKVPLNDMFKEYRSYCIDYGYRPVSLRTFGERIRNIGYETNRTNKGQIVYCTKKDLF